MKTNGASITGRIILYISLLIILIGIISNDSWIIYIGLGMISSGIILIFYGLLLHRLDIIIKYIQPQRTIIQADIEPYDEYADKPKQKKKSNINESEEPYNPFMRNPR